MTKKKVNLKLLISFVFVTVILLSVSYSAYAETYDALTYEISDNEITITDCDISATNVTIPSSINNYPVTSIGSWAFQGCINLKSITIPDSVIPIGNFAFQDCSSLTCVAISDRVTNTGSGAFYNCTNLTDVYYTGTVTEWNNITIEDYNEPIINATIHFVPSTKTTVSSDGNTFTVKPVNIENDKAVILALYNGNKFIEMQTAAYKGEELTFTTDKSYTDAKVMVWDSLDSLKTVCEAEVVK